MIDRLWLWYECIYKDMSRKEQSCQVKRYNDDDADNAYDFDDDDNNAY